MQIEYANLNVVQQVAAASNCEHEYCHGPDYIPGSLYDVSEFVSLVGQQPIADPTAQCFRAYNACVNPKAFTAKELEANLACGTPFAVCVQKFR